MAPVNTRVLKMLLDYEIRNRQAIEGNAAVAQSIKRVANEATNARTIISEYDRTLGAMGAGTSARLSILEQKFRDTAQTSRDLARAEAEVTEELRKQQGYLAQRLNNAQRFQETGFTAGLRNAAFNPPAGGSGGGRSVTGVLSGVREGLIALPNVGYQNPAVVALRGLIPLAEKTGASFGQLGTALGIAGVAVAGVAVAMKAFNDQMDASKKRLEAALSAQRAYYDALANLTSEQAGARVGELRRVRAFLEQEAAEAVGALDSAFAQLQSQFGDFDARLQISSEAFAPLRNAADNATKALQENIDTETRLTQGLREGAFAANSLREAEAELAKQREEYAQYFAGITKIETDRQLRQNTLILDIDRMTAAQREEKLRQDQRELDLINLRLQRGGLTIEAEAQLRERQGELTESILFTSEVTDTYADQLEREAALKQALSDQTDAYFNALEIEGKAREELYAARQKEEEDRAAHAAKILEIQQELADKEAELWRKAGEDIAEAEAKAQQSRIKQELQYYKQVQEIQRRANTTIALAVYARDALAAFLAAQQRDEDLRKAKEANEERLKEIDAALEEQKAVIAKRLEEQLRVARKAADDAIRQEADRRRKEAEINNRAIQAALVAYQNAAYATQQIALYGSNGQRIIHTQLWNDLATYAYTGAKNLVGNFIAGLQGSGGSSKFPPLVNPGSGTGGIGGVPGFGAFNTLPSSRSSGAAGSPVAVNINLDGETIRVTSRQQAVDVVGRLLDRQGIA